MNFTSTLIGPELSEAMEHANFAEAFGTPTSSTKFLEELYDLRSRPLHNGHMGGPVGLMSVSVEHQTRIGLTSDLVRSAVERFLRTPRSSLVGHPVIGGEPRGVGRPAPHPRFQSIRYQA